MPGVKTARVAQLVRSALIFSVKVRHGVLVISRFTRPAGVWEVGPKLGKGGVAVGIAVVELLAKVTSPFCAKARPSNVAPEFIVIDV